MNKLTRLLWIIVSMTLAACSSVATKPDELVIKKTDKVLTAQGYSRLQKISSLTQKQHQFAQEQAATVSAYRSLAKQLYQEKLADGLLVADQVIKAEPFRVYFDLFLRQAKVLQSKKVYGQKSVSLSLVITPRFYKCISSSVKVVLHCLREEGKIQFTRIGYKQAAASTVNLNCYGCSSQLSVSGFSKKKNTVDSVMLRAGLYDAEWLGNMAVSVLSRYGVLTHLVFE